MKTLFFRARLFFSSATEMWENISLHIISEQKTFPWQPQGAKRCIFICFLRNSLMHKWNCIRSLNSTRFFLLISFSSFARTAIVLWVIESLLMQMMVACETTSFCVNLFLGQRLRASVWTFSASKLNNFSEIFKISRKRYENCFFYIRRKRSKSRNGNKHKKKLSEDIHASRSGK